MSDPPPAQLLAALPLFHRVAGKAVLVEGAGEPAEAKRRLVREAGGMPVDRAAPGVQLAFLAAPEGAGDAEVETRVAALRAQGMLVNVVDRPALSDFIVPAIVDRAPVLVAIGTQGASASLAKALKERLDLLLPPGLGALAQAIRTSRAAVARRFPGVAARRAFWADLLAPGAPLDPFTPLPDPAAAIAAALADEAAPPPPPRTIRAGHEDDLTLPDLRALAAADLAVVPAGIHPTILAHLRRDATRIPVIPAKAGITGRLVILELP